MRIDIMTLFPDAVDAMMKASIIGRAQERGFVIIRTHQIREYTTNKQMQVDDYPYGGGRGAVMQADPLYRCWQHICDEAGERVHTIYMSPCGRVPTQQVARELKEQYDHLILVCGHYEGVDQRFLDECVDEEISTFVPDGPEEGEYNLVRSKRFPIKPMTRDEAILQMNLLGHSFFAFRDEDADGAFAVVYCRNDGDYGLIEDEA